MNKKAKESNNKNKQNTSIIIHLNLQLFTDKYW